MQFCMLGGTWFPVNHVSRKGSETSESEIVVYSVKTIERRSYVLDIEHIINEARWAMLDHGQVMPIINLELPSGIIIMALDAISDSQSIPVQCGILARLGLEECRRHPGEEPLAVSCYAEAWVASKPENDEQKLRPSLHPKRREVILVEMWHAEGNRRVAYQLPVIRDKKQRVTDVGSPSSKTSPAIGPLTSISWQLASFVHGVKDAHKSDEEVMSKMDAMLQRVAGLPEEKKQKLRDFMKREGMPEDLI
jgi:hypothetical protein